MTGSIVTEFTDPDYFGSTIQPMTFPYESKMRYAPWKYGLVRKVTYYNSASPNEVVKQEEYKYNNPLLEQVSNNSNFYSVKLEVNRTRSFPFTQQVIDPTDITYQGYYPITGRVELIETKIKNFISNGSYNEAITSFNYDNNNYQVREVESVNSKGITYGEKISYPFNYTGMSGALASMRTDNMINVPISQIKWVKYSGSSIKKIINASVTEFEQVANGDIKPVRLYKSYLGEPIESNILDDIHMSGNLINYTFLRLSKTLTYGSDGSVSTVESSGSSSKSVLYDYNGQLPVATISNGKISDGVAYTSFEANGNYEAGGIGKWGYGQHLVKNENDAITGEKVYDLSGSLWHNSLNPQKKYTLSFWIKGPRPGININYPGGGSQIIDNQFQLLKSINGWDLYVGHFQGAEGVGIWRWGGDNSNSVIDELRLVPYSSVINTVTYNPRFGKTSECDANNKTSYYDYNSAGQLSTVRNENRDIVKTYEYNYVKIGNDALSQAFNKQCGNGQVGSSITYSVPANKYYASSKEEANQLAQNDINSNGQNYADNDPSAVCTTATIYARIEYLNAFGGGYSSYADVVVRFYSDLSCTQPLSVSNLTLNLEEFIDLNNYYGNTYTNSSTFTAVANGTEYVIGTSFLLSDTDTYYYGTYTRQFYVQAGTGYVVVN